MKMLPSFFFFLELNISPPAAKLIVVFELFQMAGLLNMFSEFGISGIFLSGGDEQFSKAFIHIASNAFGSPKFIAPIFLRSHIKVFVAIEIIQGGGMRRGATKKEILLLIDYLMNNIDEVLFFTDYN
ncbi:hypothetical protein ACJX0J_028914, partial [Zea mays]